MTAYFTKIQNLILYPCLFFLLLICSCESNKTSEPQSAEEENAIVQEKERGPVKVTLRVEPKEVSFAERIRYSITTVAEKGIEVHLPSPGENIPTMPNEVMDPTKFIVRDYLPLPMETLPDGRVKQGQSYILEVIASGEYTIPETTISFLDKRPDEEAPNQPVDTPESPDSLTNSSLPTIEGDDLSLENEKVFKIVMDPLKIKVKDLGDEAALEDLRPIEGPIEPELVPPSLKWPLIGVGSLVGLVVLIYLAIKFHRREVTAPPPIPAEELAYQELEWLLQQGFTDRGELREFYFHLSRIVREYIERRFGLRAPERTTEEFLEELARSETLGAKHKKLLEHFLEKADLVKFAKYAPEPEEISGSFEAAKDFISETRRQPGEATSGVR